jgi:hypothetical protein
MLGFLYNLPRFGRPITLHSSLDISRVIVGTLCEWECERADPTTAAAAGERGIHMPDATAPHLPAQGCALRVRARGRKCASMGNRSRRGRSDAARAAAAWCGYGSWLSARSPHLPAQGCALRVSTRARAEMRVHGMGKSESEGWGSGLSARGPLACVRLDVSTYACSAYHCVVSADGTRCTRGACVRVCVCNRRWAFWVPACGF